MNYISKFYFTGKDVDTLSNKITQRKEEIQYFDLNTPQIRDERWQNVEKAMLHMHLPNATDPHDTEVWIQVKMVMMNKHHGVIFKQKHNFKTELLPDQGGWIEIDVRDMVSHWMKGQNYGFTISVESAKGQKLNTSFQHQQQNGQVSLHTILCTCKNLLGKKMEYYTNISNCTYLIIFSKNNFFSRLHFCN